MGTPKADGTFDVYNTVKNYLIDLGIPKEEIAFIHDAKNDAERQDIFRKTNAGQIKVLFGSTDKCGTGVNVQTHLVAMHHIDCPWKPSAIEQRNGRRHTPEMRTKKLQYITILRKVLSMHIAGLWSRTNRSLYRKL